ncbi:TAXI family TRAP transporter solute-binding subunit [Geoalkalibacter sp.]|uniref:TAXI family TRAP transporter solute-binding subunit n=1 Tax=Geoalkalibacter sp. TaxID=3041440 RepID=UPI00272DCB5A|nr:TAXI family TRAP transporter solute-binding subunit [Geoalkalibacter sp.]
MRRLIPKLVVLLSLLLVLVALAGCEKRGRSVRLGGGPSGGTFQVVAEGLAKILQPAHPGVRFVVERSAGSSANLRALEEGKLDLALVYAGDFYGEEPGGGLAVRANVQILTRLYDAVAQLAVLSSSRITLPTQLRGARIAIGNPGSGAALAAERYFRALGIWEQIVPVYLGYDMAIAELLRGNLVAVWELVGVPSASFAAATRQVPLRLLNLQEAAHGGHFFDLYPFYRPVDIPAGTYPGQERAMTSFADTALLAASRELSRDMSWRILEGMFNEDGLGALRGLHPSLAAFSAEAALEGVELPLHPGAVHYWQQQGRDLPASLLPAVP